MRTTANLLRMYRNPDSPLEQNRCGYHRWCRMALSLVLGAGALGPVSRAAAQTPGLPMLQNAFTSPGRAVAANYGHGDAFSTIAVAGAWTPASNRFQVSAGAGLVSPDGPADHATGVGARLAVPIRTKWTAPTSSLGAALFAGVGGAWWSGAGELRVPVGGSLAYRRRVGETRAVAAYVAPYFQWSRRTGHRDADPPATVAEGEEGPDTEARQDSDLIRAALGVDVLLTPRISLSAGYDFGEGAEAGRPGPTSGVFGVGIGWSF